MAVKRQMQLQNQIGEQNKKTIITVAAKVQIHNSCHCLNIARICHLPFKGNFRARKSAEKDKYMKDRRVKSFPYEKRLDRFRIPGLEKKGTE